MVLRVGTLYDINLFLASNGPAFNVRTVLGGSIIIIPCIWFGITTNSYNDTYGKCFGNSNHISYAICPDSDKIIFALDTLPKYDIIP